MLEAVPKETWFGKIYVGVTGFIETNSLPWRNCYVVCEFDFLSKRTQWLQQRQYSYY